MYAVHYPLDITSTVTSTPNKWRCDFGSSGRQLSLSVMRRQLVRCLKPLVLGAWISWMAEVAFAKGRIGRPSAVLWDIDGTLVNSKDLAFSSTNLVLKQNGFQEVSEKEYVEATRLTTPKRLAFHATKDVEAEIGPKLAEEFDRHYVQLVSPTTVPLFPGLQDVLEHLKKEGLVLGALSNACGAYVRAVLQTHGWAEVFQTKLGADEVPEAKPQPGGLLKLGKQTSVPIFLSLFRKPLSFGVLFSEGDRNKMI